jgi:hypothetical protein
MQTHNVQVCYWPNADDGHADYNNELRKIWPLDPPNMAYRFYFLSTAELRSADILTVPIITSYLLLHAHDSNRNYSKLPYKLDSATQRSGVLNKQTSHRCLHRAYILSYCLESYQKMHHLMLNKRTLCLPCFIWMNGVNFCRVRITRQAFVLHQLRSSWRCKNSPWRWQSPPKHVGAEIIL